MVEPPDPPEEPIKKGDVACPDCEKVVSSKSLKRHQREQHSEQHFVCRFCGYSTWWQDSLERHERAQHPELFLNPTTTLGRKEAVVTVRVVVLQEPEVRGSCPDGAALEAPESVEEPAPPAKVARPDPRPIPTDPDVSCLRYPSVKPNGESISGIYGPTD